MVNADTTLLIRSNRIKGNIQENGKSSNIIARIPINVQQGQVINYEPQTPVRFNLGQSSDITNIDITITDNYGNLVDFNGNPHDLTFVFEKWSVVSLPVAKPDHSTMTPSNPQTLMGAHMPMSIDLTAPQRIARAYGNKDN